MSETWNSEASRADIEAERERIRRELETVGARAAAMVLELGHDQNKAIAEMAEQCADLRRQLAEAQGRIATLEGALRFYADAGLYRLRHVGGGGAWNPIADDKGETARAALSTPPSPVADVVRAAVALDKAEREYQAACDRRDWQAAEDAIHAGCVSALDTAVAALLAAQPEWGEGR